MRIIRGGRTVAVVVERTSLENFENLLPLISAYQKFFEIEVDEEKNRLFFRQFVDDDTRGIQYLASISGQVVGFATVYFTFSSSRAEKVAVFNDLYVVPERRLTIVAANLIKEALKEVFLVRGYRLLRAETRHGNVRALSLYEKLLKRSSGIKGMTTSWYHFDLELI
jgi:GNAT superfamily N-acetyltransferase